MQDHRYDPDTLTLTVMFTNGSIYQYSGVPITEAHNLAQAGSPGTYFWTKIRDRYPTTKIVAAPKKR